MESAASTHQPPVLGERTTGAPRPVTPYQSSSANQILLALLWLCWIVTATVVVSIKVQAALTGPLVIDWVALAIRLLLLGSIGWLVATLIEMRLMPWRFVE
jgi:hypothetical protein